MLQATQGCPGRPGRRHEGQVYWRLSLRGRGALREEVVVASGGVVLALVICGAAVRRLSGRGPGWGGVTGREGGPASRLGRATRGSRQSPGSPAGLGARGRLGANAGAAPYLPIRLIHDREFGSVSLPPLDYTPQPPPISSLLSTSLRKPEAAPRCHPLPTKPTPPFPRPARALPLGSAPTSIEGEGPVGDELARLQAVHERPHPARTAEEGVAPGAQRA